MFRQTGRMVLVFFLSTVRILDAGIKLDAKIQTRTLTTKNLSPEVLGTNFDNVFVVCKLQTINIAYSKPLPGFIFVDVHTSIKST